MTGRERPLPDGRSRQVTAAASWEGDVVISRDGTLLAYASNEDDNVDVWMVDVTGGNSLRLTDDPASDRSPSWYIDGSAVAFASDRGGENAIWRVPRFGGSATMLVPNADAPAISPDGRRIAFTRPGAGGEPRIAVASLKDPTDARVLTGPTDGLWGHDDPAWSPDGRWLAYADFRDLWLVPAEGGEARQLTAESAGDREPAWSADGKFIYFTSSREGTQAIWRVSTKGGSPQRLTVGTGSESHPSLSADGRSLAYSTSVHDLDARIVDLATGETLTVPGEQREWGPTIAPDGGSLVFVANHGLNAEDNLWRQPLDGMALAGEAVRLNDERAESSNPVYSPDGLWVAYQRREGPDRNIWILPSVGGVPHAVTQGAGNRIHPTWSPDGSQLAYVSDQEGRSKLWAVAVAEGHPVGDAREVEIGAEVVAWPDWSPDGAADRLCRFRRGLLGDLAHLGGRQRAAAAGPQGRVR